MIRNYLNLGIGLLCISKCIHAIAIDLDGYSRDQLVLSPSGGEFDSPVRFASDHESCPINSPLSCSTESVHDSCCYEGTNGLFLSTQFWDYYPATGPDDLFTLHGLWNDKCNGGYQQYCNPSWAIDNATEVLEELGYTELLGEMNRVWKNLYNTDEDLWLHEFNKHGTCMSTVNPKCYGKDAEKYQYVGDFFTTAVELFKKLPTYEFLAAADIHPSTSETYTLQQFQDVLSPHVGGASIFLQCDQHNALLEVWYYFKLKGSVADGTFTPVDAIAKYSKCKDKFYWLPKGTKNGGGGGGGGGGGSGTRGYLKLSGQNGCLIGNGRWYTSGTCATYTVIKTVGGVSIKSAKGYCNIVDGAFTCNKAIPAGDFVLEEKNIISYGGEETWSAPNSPGRNQQVNISPGSSGDITFELKFVPR